MPRTIAIGDVHGCANEYEELLHRLDLQPGDRVIQLGDQINRGPNSHRVIELSLAYNVEAILGNHELRILRARRERNHDLLKDYDKVTIDQLTQTDWNYIESLPGYIYDFTKDVIFVHGGFLPDKAWQTQSIETITSIQVIDKDGNAAKRSDAPKAPPLGRQLVRKTFCHLWPHSTPGYHAAPWFPRYRHRLRLRWEPQCLHY